MPLLLDGDAAPPEHLVREVGVDRLVGDAVALRDDGLEETEQADRGDDPNDRGGAPQRAEDERLERERHRARGDHGDDERGKRRPPVARP